MRGPFWCQRRQQCPSQLLCAEAGATERGERDSMYTALGDRGSCTVLVTYLIRQGGGPSGTVGDELMRIDRPSVRETNHRSAP